MYKKGEKYGLMILAVVAVVAVIGLVTYFGNQTAIGASIAGPSFEKKTWEGTVATEEQLAARNQGSSPEGIACAENILEDAKLWTADVTYKIGVECGKCCKDQLGEFSLDVNECANVCKPLLEKMVFEAQSIGAR